MSVVDQSFFFTPLERDRIAHLPFTTNVRPSLSSLLLKPVWSIVGSFIPETVAPNSISLLGTLCTAQAYYVMSQYASEQPTQATVIASILLTLASGCSVLDGVQARLYRTGSPLGDIFSKVCGSCNIVFQAFTFLYFIGLVPSKDPSDSAATWYLLLSLHLLEFMVVLARIAATPREGVNRSGIVGRTLEYIPYAIRESEIGTCLGLVMVSNLFFPQVAPVARSLIVQYSATVYTAMIACSLTAILLLDSRIIEWRCRLAILFCLALRCLPTLLLLPLSTTTDLTTVTDALMVSLLSVEMYVSYFAQRRIHAAVILLCFLSRFSAVATLSLLVLYVVGLLADLSYATKIPLFVPVRNVFIDGVYDLCHVGHKRVMEHALKYGNRLVVGVLSDEDCVGYKRRPVMTTEERCREVASCRFVSEVVAGSPCDGLTEEFLKKHNIHVVVCGEEYDKPTDHYYAVPRKMGILKTAPRTDGMSTSILIKRIKATDDEALIAKDKLRGSAVQEGS